MKIEPADRHVEQGAINRHVSLIAYPLQQALKTIAVPQQQVRRFRANGTTLEVLAENRK